MLKIATGNKFPLQLGFDYGGIIVEKGSQVEQFQIGDEVFGFLNQLPGRTYAEYAIIPASLLVKKPHNQSFIEAAATPLALLPLCKSCAILAIFKQEIGF